MHVDLSMYRKNLNLCAFEMGAIHLIDLISCGNRVGCFENQRGLELPKQLPFSVLLQQLILCHCCLIFKGAKCSGEISLANAKINVWDKMSS